MKDKPKVSIIVPVYNAEKCLDRCVESIIQQSFTDWELLLVDDGSTDDSVAICDSYTDKDNRIKVFHKNNGGVSSARNLGLDNAIGEYVSFVDADDYVAVDYLEKMFACTPVDLIICGFANEGKTIFHPEKVNIDTLYHSRFLKKKFEVPYYLDTPWCKFFKNCIISENNLRFDQSLKLSEDTLFCYHYIYYCNSVQIVSETLYNYDGQWGGEFKYWLTYDEISYMLTVVTGAINAVNKRFDCSIESKYKCFHVSKLMGLFTDYNDHQIYNLYHQHHPTMTEADFLGDYRLSPLVVGALKAQKFAKIGNKKETIDFLKKLSDFSTTPIFKIHFQSFKHLFFFWVLKCLGPMWTYWIIKVCFSFPVVFFSALLEKQN